MNSLLSGKSIVNEHTLLGRSNYMNNSNIPLEIHKFKNKMQNDYLIPFYKKDWKKLHENLLFLPNLKRKLDKFKHLSPIFDLSFYQDLLHLLEIIVEKERLLEQNIGNKHRISLEEKEFAMMVRLAPIRLLPEYEIYNSIFGKPNRDEKEIYDLNKIKTIQTLLTRENIDFEQIKLYFDFDFV
jgi:hypothetical protein